MPGGLTPIPRPEIVTPECGGGTVYTGSGSGSGSRDAIGICGYETEELDEKENRYVSLLQRWNVVVPNGKLRFLEMNVRHSTFGY